MNTLKAKHPVTSQISLMLLSKIFLLLSRVQLVRLVLPVQVGAVVDLLLHQAWHQETPPLRAVSTTHGTEPNGLSQEQVLLKRLKRRSAKCSHHKHGCLIWIVANTRNCLNLFAVLSMVGCMKHHKDLSVLLPN